MQARKPIPPQHVNGEKGWTATKGGKVFDEKGKERKGTPVKGGTSDAEGESNSRGHLKVNVGDGVFAYVHRLVAAAFGEKIDGAEVLHSDDQKKGHNNKLSNLRGGSRTENAADRKLHNKRIVAGLKGKK